MRRLDDCQTLDTMLWFFVLLVQNSDDVKLGVLWSKGGMGVWWGLTDGDFAGRFILSSALRREILAPKYKSMMFRQLRVCSSVAE